MMMSTTCMVWDFNVGFFFCYLCGMLLVEKGGEGAGMFFLEGLDGIQMDML